MKLKYSILIILLSGIWIFCRGEGTMSLEECLDAALGSNLQLRAGALRLEKNNILTGTAFDAPDTGIELTQDATEGGGMENGLKFSQEFSFPTVYIAKHKVLKAAVKVAASELEDTRNTIICKITSAYYNALYFKHLKSIMLQRKDAYTRFSEIAGKRYEAGESSRLEFLNADRMAVKAEMDLNDVLLRYREATGELASLLGESNEVEPSEELLYVLDSVNILEEPLFSNTVRGRLFEANIKQNEENLFLAKQDFLPGITLSATSQLLIKSFNPYGIDRMRFDKGNFMGFSVGISVPLFFGAKRSRLLAAQREVEISRLMCEDENLKMAQEYRTARQELETIGKNLDYFEKSGIGKVTELRKLADISYKLGEIDYLEYMQNMETASEMETDYLDCINRYNQCIIKIQALK